MKTINIKTAIPKDHKLVIDLPEDLPTGLADIVVIIVPENSESEKKGKTVGDMLKSPLFGVWKNRKDIIDSMEFARKLRENAEKRKHSGN